MRILNVIHSLNPAIGGPAEALRGLAAAQRSLGNHQEIACLDSPAAPWLSEFPVPVHPLGPARSSFGFAPRLAPWLREHAPNYDVLIVNGLWQYHGLAVHQALRRSRQPYYVFPHGMLDPWFKQAYPLKHLKKSVYWAIAQSRILRHAAGVFFTSEQEQLRARQTFQPYQCHEITLGYGIPDPSGIPETQTSLFLERHPECHGKTLWLFLGRLHPKKGCDLLLHAFARAARSHPNLHLVLAGPDQLDFQAQLRTLARELQVLPRVTWTGLLQGDLKWGALRAADLFLLPSHQENFGVAVAEALACRLPTLLSHEVNIWREIVAADAGFAAPDTLEGLHGIAEKWSALPDTRRTAMRANARACYEQHYQVERVARRLAHHLQTGIDQAPANCRRNTLTRPSPAPSVPAVSHPHAG